eukprot:SAG22_NODE_309_length_12657_cov_34.643733_8_plen_70_part_01
MLLEKRASQQTNSIAPAYWKVRWWSSASPAAPSEYSAPAVLHMGLLTKTDWQGALPIDAAAYVPPPPGPP